MFRAFGARDTLLAALGLRNLKGTSELGRAYGEDWCGFPVQQLLERLSPPN